MDPLTIAVGCVSLVATISKLSEVISTFIRDVRTSRSELDAVSRELLSLKTVLELLEEDTSEDVSGSFPETLRLQIIGIVSNCDTVVAEIESVLMSHVGNRIDKSAKWVLAGKGDVNKLRLSLEAHKSALEIALDMVTLTVTKRIENNTEDLLVNTDAIKQDTEHILEEIARLRAHLPSENQGVASNLVLDRYLNDLTSYAETVAVDDVHSESDNEPTQAASTAAVRLDEEELEEAATTAHQLESPKSLRPVQEHSPHNSHIRDRSRHSTPVSSHGSREFKHVDDSHNSVSLTEETSTAASTSKEIETMSSVSVEVYIPLKFEQTFRWDSQATEVYVAGDFDAWSKSIKLERLGPDEFRSTVILPMLNKKKVFYKYVVDGCWRNNPAEAVEQDDETGFVRHVIQNPHPMSPIGSVRKYNLQGSEQPRSIGDSSAREAQEAQESSPRTSSSPRVSQSLSTRFQETRTVGERVDYSPDSARSATRTFFDQDDGERFDDHQNPREHCNAKMYDIGHRSIWTADMPVPAEIFAQLPHRRWDSAFIRYSAVMGDPSLISRRGYTLRARKTTELLIGIDMRRQSSKGETYNAALVTTLASLMDELRTTQFSADFIYRSGGAPLRAIVVCIVMHLDREKDVPWLRKLGINFAWDVPPAFIEGGQRGSGGYFDDGIISRRKILGKEVRTVLKEYTTTFSLKSGPNNSATPNVTSKHIPIQIILCSTERGPNLFFDSNADTWLRPIGELLDARLCILVKGGATVTPGSIQKQWRLYKDISKPSETGTKIRIEDYVG